MTLAIRSNPLTARADARSTNAIFRRRPEDEQRELAERSALRRPSAKRTFVDARHRRNAVHDICHLPGLEETLHVIARGNFPLWSIVPAVISLSGAKIARLSLATLGFSASNVTDLLALIDASEIAQVQVVASVYFERGNPAEFRMMSDGLKYRGQQIAALRSHAKIITMALSDGRKFAVESSANLRSCRNIEQFSLTQSPALHDFHAGWIADVIATAAREDAKRR